MARAFLLVAASLGLLASAADWQKGAPMPVARSEVAAAPFRGGIAIVGGFRAPCTSSRNVDLYLSAAKRWRHLPDLPVAVNHAAAASSGGRLYVVGGFGGGATPWIRSAFVYDRARWRRLRKMPGPREAAGAAIVGGKLYVVGGVTPSGLAQTTLVLDLGTGLWTTIPGPTPREHLAVTAVGDRVYALAGRLGGLDSNLATFEAFSPLSGRWETLAPVPEPRSGTGLAFAGGLLVSVGGEGSGDTIRSVFGYDVASNTWRRLPDLPTPRHGMAVAAVGDRVYAIGGSPLPDCGWNRANEYLDLAS